MGYICRKCSADCASWKTTCPRCGRSQPDASQIQQPPAYGSENPSHQEIADLRQQVERLRAELAEAKKYGAPVADARRLPHAGKKTCEHNDYWTTAYGGCMACRAVTAESELSRAREAIGVGVQIVRGVLSIAEACAGYMDKELGGTRVKDSVVLIEARNYLAAAAVKEKGEHRERQSNDDAQSLHR